MAKFNLEHKKPFITSKILSNEKSQRILDEIGLGGESIDILYYMNKGNRINEKIHYGALLKL